jgi:hypothetical protein
MFRTWVLSVCQIIQSSSYMGTRRYSSPTVASRQRNLVWTLVLQFCPRISQRSDMHDGTRLSNFTACVDEPPRRVIMLGAYPAPEPRTIHKVACEFRRIYQRREKGPGVLPPRESIGWEANQRHPQEGLQELRCPPSYLTSSSHSPSPGPWSRHSTCRYLCRHRPGP